MKQVNHIPHFYNSKSTNNECNATEKWGNKAKYILCKANYDVDDKNDNNCTQLFTQLKLHKYNSNAEQCQTFQQMGRVQSHGNRQIKYTHVFEQQDKYKECNSIQNSKGMLKLNEQQLTDLQMLKIMYAKYLAEQHFETGKSIKNMLHTLIPQLEIRIQHIVQNDGSKAQIHNHPRVLTFAQQLYPTQQDLEMSNKNLQSTAQYWQHSTEKKLTSTNLNSSINTKNLKKLTIDVNLIQNRQQPKTQNGAKFYKNKQLQYEVSQFHSFERKVENRNQNMKELSNINIVQFTLGGKEDQENEQQIQQKRNNQTNIFQIGSEHENIDHQYITTQKVSSVVSQFRENQKQILNFPRTSSKTYELLKSSCQTKKVPEFNRKKIPKGKAIKNRVMGNMSNENIQV